MDAENEQAKAKLSTVAGELGREIRVYTSPAISVTSSEPSASSNEESDAFYDLTPEDYYKIISGRIGEKSQFLKTRKIREREAAAEAVARRTRMPKAVIRVRFPDNLILETKFQASDKIQTLMDLIPKVVARPDRPFYLYTTPPKKRIEDTSRDFYEAGFAPGANVYFSYDLPKGSESQSAEDMGPYLRDDIRSLCGLESRCDKVDSEAKPSIMETPPVVCEPARVAKKPTKPKWLKL